MLPTAGMHATTDCRFFSLSLSFNQQSEYKAFYKLMCWLAGWLAGWESNL
jgi:hypothetical protein